MSLFNVDARITPTGKDGDGKNLAVDEITIGFGNEQVIRRKVQDKLGITENLRTSKVVAEAAGGIIAPNGTVDKAAKTYTTLNAHAKKMTDRYVDVKQEADAILNQFSTDFRSLLNEGDEYQDAYRTAYEKADKALKLSIQRINIRYPKQFIDYFQKASIAKLHAENPGTI